MSEMLAKAGTARRRFRELKKIEYTPETYRLYVGGEYAEMMFAMIDHAGCSEDKYHGFEVTLDDDVEMQFRLIPVNTKKEFQKVL